LARESFRLHQQQLTLDIVVMPKMGIETVPNAELHQQLQFAWQKLQRLAKKHQKIAPSLQK
jgi:ribonuclease P protein component